MVASLILGFVGLLGWGAVSLAYVSPGSVPWGPQQPGPNDAYGGIESIILVVQGTVMTLVGLPVALLLLLLFTRSNAVKYIYLTFVSILAAFVVAISVPLVGMVLEYWADMAPFAWVPSLAEVVLPASALLLSAILACLKASAPFFRRSRARLSTVYFPAVSHAPAVAPTSVVYPAQPAYPGQASVYSGQASLYSGQSVQPGQQAVLPDGDLR